MGEQKQNPVIARAQLPLGKYGDLSAGIGVKITEIKQLKITQFAFFPEQASAMKSALKRQFSVSGLPEPAASITENKIVFARPELTKIWLFCDSGRSDTLPNGMKKYYPLDISASRVGLLLTGPYAGELINRQSAVDLSCPVGSFMATAMHHTGVHILKFGPEKFLLLLPSSFAESIAHGLMDIAAQFGVEIRKPMKWSAGI